MGSRRVLAAILSAVAAMLILGASAWVLLGNGNGNPQSDGDVQIIPPADEADSAEHANTADSAVTGQPVSTAEPAAIVVYLTGEVVDPGVYTVEPGQRLASVVDMAGGPTENADLDRVNLAAYVADAAHYRIPALGETEGEPVSSTAASSVDTGTTSGDVDAAGDCAVPIDINLATAECLETLPGIGTVRAASIVLHREQNGPFATADGITAVSGIGDGIYGRIANMITVGTR